MPKRGHKRKASDEAWEMAEQGLARWEKAARTGTGPRGTKSRTRYTATPLPAPAPVRPGGYRYAAPTGEDKFIDTHVAAAAVATTGVGQLLIAIPQGDTASTRTGNSCILGVQHMKFTVFPTTQNGMSYDGDYMRILLVRDRANNLATAPPALNLILDDDNIPGLWHSYLRLDQQHRFDIVKDEVYHVGYNGPMTATDASTETRFIKWSYMPKLEKNAKIQYQTNTTTGTQGTITSVCYFLYFVTQAGDLSVERSSRHRFKDG
jgi:hypothetical protein